MLMFAAQRSSPQQPAAPVFQAESNLVVVRTQVFDRETRQPIVGLTRSDFQVFDESSLAELTVFDDSPAPLNMLLLTDVSGGFRNQHINSCGIALRHSLTPQDQIALMSFSDNPPKLRTHFTSAGDEKVILQGWNLVFGKDRNNGMRGALKTSRIFDAIDAAAQYFLKTPRVRRPAIVVVTHNREGKSKTTKSRALELAGVFRDLGSRCRPPGDWLLGLFDGDKYFRTNQSSATHRGSHSISRGPRFDRAICEGDWRADAPG
jgi:hypothetical protein